MGLDDFWDHFSEPFQKCIEGHPPSPTDKAQVCAAINDIEKSESLNLDPTLRQNYIRALILSTLWVDHKVTDPDVHMYAQDLVQRTSTNTTIGKDNTFFYYELNQASSSDSFFRPRYGDMWFTK
jgi:hypothetical protein